MTASRPHIQWYPCPKCNAKDRAIKVRLPVGQQTAVFSLCGCYASQVRLDGEERFRTPHDSLARALQELGVENVPVRLEGYPEPFDDIDELLAVYTDFTQAPQGAAVASREREGGGTASRPCESSGRGGPSGLGGPSLPNANAADTNSIDKESMHLVPSLHLAHGADGDGASSPEQNATHDVRPFTLSVVKNTKPGGKLCKVLRYDESIGEVVAETNAYLSEGQVSEVTFSSIRDFMAFRADLEGESALMMGKALYADARIITQAKLSSLSAEQLRRERIIARDRAHVSWPDGPTLVMLDLDRPDEFPAEVRGRVPTAPEGWRELLIEIFPGLADTQMAWAPSSSSYIYVGDQELHGLRGQRFYLVIDSGQEVSRFAEVLHDALALRGLVWYEVSKSGSLLKRFPFDLAVFQPERLDFASGPECIPPLEWRPDPPIIWNDGGAYLAGSDLPRTTEANRRRIEARLNDARRAKLDEAAARRTKWMEDTGRKIAIQQGVDPDQAEAVAESALDRGVLLPEFLLVDSDGTTVSVGALLDDPDKHHGRRFHDPLEPEYRNDPRIAVFLVSDKGEPRVYSHAHGGQWWRCERAVPVVWVGLIHKTVDQLSKGLERDDCGLYLNGNALVWVNEAAARMETLDPDGLGLRLQRRFKVQGRDRQGHIVPRNLTLRDLRALRSDAPVLPLRRLNAVVHGPFALADGSIVDKPGYDPVSEVFYAADSPYPPRVRQHLKLPEAEEALRRLWYPVHLFPLETDLDRGVLLAAMLSALIRPSIEIAPGYYFTAHTAGTGKTLLASVVGALQIGCPVASSPLPRHEEERRKHLFASLRHGVQYLLYDNAERGSELDSAVLANLITSPEMEARVLGVSDIERRPNRMTVALTGNNLVLRGDLNRRVLPVTLDAGLEHPWQREFDFHPVNYVLANWLALRIAALEVIQAWRTDGEPRVEGATGFPEWDEIIRSVVTWVSNKVDIGVGFTDPIEALRAAYAEDPETELLGNLLQAWKAVFGQDEVLLKDVEDAVSEAAIHDIPGVTKDQEVESRDPAVALSEALDAVLSENAGWRYQETRARTLGIYLGQHEGRVVSGLKFVRGGKRGGSRKWRVIAVDQTPEKAPVATSDLDDSDEPVTAKT